MGELAGEGAFEGALRKMVANRNDGRGYFDEKCVGFRRNQKNITHHNNFLQHSGFLKSNLSFEEVV